jgi:hypothetical protein
MLRMPRSVTCSIRGRTARWCGQRAEVPPRPAPDLTVEEVPHDAVDHLRVAWDREEFPDQETCGSSALPNEAAPRDARIETMHERSQAGRWQTASMLLPSGSRT